MLRRLSVGVMVSAIAIIPLPANAQDRTAEDLGGVMSISLKDGQADHWHPRCTAGAGTPNQNRWFLPFSVGDNSVWFIDALVNATSAIVRVMAASATLMLLMGSQPPHASVIAG